MKRKIIAGAVIGVGVAYALGFTFLSSKVPPADVQSCVIMAQWC